MTNEQVPADDPHVAALKAARAALSLAQSSHNVMLTSLPPQDAWIARGVPERIADALRQINALIPQSD